MTILDEIISYKKHEVAAAKKEIPLSKLQILLQEASAPRDFYKAIQKKIHSHQPAIIAEIKKASPSKGIIREDFDPIIIAKDYAQHGAACLSILTDKKFFQGDLHYLQSIRDVCDLPLLRKDFMIDPYQIYEAKLAGADCILLIVSALTDETLVNLFKIAKQLSLSVLIEIHDVSELKRVLALNLEQFLLGINNRDLKNFKTDLNTTIELLSSIPKDCLIITESGINTKEDVSLMMAHGVYGFLVGESLMRAESPGKQLQLLFS